MDLVSLHKLDTGQDRHRLSDQGAAWLTPQVGVFKDHHVLKRVLDGGDVVGERRRAHAGVNRRESAPNVDDIDGHASLNDQARNLSHGSTIGARCHALATHMEAHAQLIGMGAGLADKVGRFSFASTKFARQRQGRAFVGDRKAHHQGQVLGVLGLFENFLQLGFTVEHENLYAMVEIGAPDGMAAFDRVHVGYGCTGTALAHQLDLGKRGSIKPAHARCVEGIDHPRRRVCFNSVKHFTGKIVLEPGGRDS
eukprot:TRINITY_DN21564_c0_g1_i1.p2 TRINITY_DN21564_c0_g1~~TRINITY_DN21564_c0_g1_i1.p2  ORF type:complete len:252 (+),score=-4.76 TRINITY_DN21564_c0_g1_i1:506-1261(+)